MQLSFFNTIHLSGSTLSAAKKQTGVQDERVLEIIREHGELTPFQVTEIYNKKFPPVPITSLRRSMTVLTKKRGLLIKMPKMKDERLGKPNHVWKISDKK